LHLPILFCSLKDMSIDLGPTTELLTIADVARILKVSESTVWRLKQQRRIPFLKVGGCVRISNEDLKSYLTGARVGPID
jgi:excisionase family DNA binding protein